METLKEVILVKEVTHPLIIIVVSLLVYAFFNKIIKKIYVKPTKKMDQKKRQTILTVVRSIIKYIIFAFDIILILSVYGVDVKAIVASLGIIGAVLGLAMQDFLKDIIAGASIIFEDQFRVGDWVEIGGFSGEVISLGLKATRIRAYTGEIKIISNRIITEFVNYNIDNAMAIVDVTVSYEADLLKVEKVLEKVCAEQQDKIPFLKGNIQVLGVQELSQDGVVYRVTAPVESMQHYGVQRLLRRAIKIAFDKNHIKLSYRQVVVHDERV